MTAKWNIKSVKVIIICMISFMLFNFLTTVSLNIFIPAVAEMKGIDTAVLYNANTIGNLVAAFLALFVGALSKKVSLKHLTVTGLIIGGVSYILIARSPAAMTGIFVATNYIATMFYAQLTVGARIGNWYPKRKGEILGIVTAIIVISSLVWLPLFSRASGAFGIANTMTAVGLIVIALALTGLFVIEDKPQEAGLLPENMTEEAYAAYRAETGTTEGDTTKWNFAKLLKQPRFVLFSIGWGLSFPGMMGFSIAIIPIMTSAGVAAQTAVRVAQFAGIFQLLGSVISGFIDTRIGQRFVITLFLGLEIVGLALFAFAPAGAVPLMIVGYYVVMFMMGAPNNLQQSSYLTLAGSGGHAYMIVYSLGTTFAAVIRAFTSSILAYSTGHYGSYTFAFIVFLVGSILSVLLLNICGFRKLEEPDDAT